MSTISKIDYSIVIPVYFNMGSLKSTMTAINDQVLVYNSGLSGEIIFIDDGSGDASLSELLEIRESYPHIVTVIKLTRNFGQVNAIMAGLAHAKGGCAITMSADGQDPAMLINNMLKTHFEEKAEIVACSRQERDESLYRIVTSKLFYTLMKKLSFPDMPTGGFDFVLLGRPVIDVLLRHREAHPFFQGQVLATGFKTKFIEYHRLERKAGKSRWTFGKKLTYLIDGMLGYSFLPIRLISVIGILVALLGFFYAAIIFIGKIAWGNPVQGWSPLMIVVLVMGGFQMLMLGILGEYMWRILAQVRNRPSYIIETIYDNCNLQEGSLFKA